MRFLTLAATAAAVLSTAASAATVTYTVTGVLDISSNRGPAGPTLAAELGSPTTFEASFVFDTATPDGNPTVDQGLFMAKSATIKVDGQQLFTTTAALMELNNPVINSNYGPETFSLRAGLNRIGAVGPETIGFAAEIAFPLHGFNPDVIPTGGNTFNNMLWGVGVLDVSPPGNQSIAFRYTSWDSDQQLRASISPAPEPGEWALISSGLGIVGAAVRRRRKD